MTVVKSSIQRIVTSDNFLPRPEFSLRRVSNHMLVHTADKNVVLKPLG